MCQFSGNVNVTNLKLVLEKLGQNRQNKKKDKNGGLKSTHSSLIYHKKKNVL